MNLYTGEANVKRLLLSILALSLASCVVVAKQPSSQPGPSGPPPPQPNPEGAPPVPQGVPVYDARKQLKYDAALDDCYDAARKALGFMKFTESDLDKKTGVITAQSGTVFVRASMYRRNHHTYLTFYFRVHGHRADARMPGDFADRCHKFVGKEVKEEGRD